MTIRERLIKGLLADGWTYDNKGYDAFTKPATTNPAVRVKVFVGTNGGLRSGSSRSNSHSVGYPGSPTKFYTRILELGTEPEQLSKRDLVNKLLA